VAVALRAAAPTDDRRQAARAGVNAVARLIETVGQRRTLRDLGLGRDSIELLVRDALDDPAIRNSPRLPTVAEATAILEAMAG
jgi:alcohol dehydrogenase class IV